MNHIWFGMNLKDAVQQPRVHAQLVPDVVFAETRMPEKFVKKLKQFKHKVSFMLTLFFRKSGIKSLRVSIP